MTKTRRLALIDGPAIFHRGYHAIPHLTNAQGMPTNAVYGFTTMLLKVLQELKPDYLVVAWDKSSQTFRNEMYSEYKATRTKQPDDLYEQMPWARKIVEVLGLPYVEIDNFEADDIIGTLAAKATGLDTIIVTGDLDELQLIDEHTRVYTMRRGFTDTVIYDLAKMQERYGLTPAQFIDFKALKGDASDNIPGVAGIGEKTAANLIGQYGSLDGIYDHVAEIPGKLGERLAEGKETAYLSQKLSRIVLDVPVELDLKAATVGRHDRQAVYDLFRQLDFKSLLAKLPEAPKATRLSLFESEPIERPHLDNANYQGVTTKAQLEDLVAKLKGVKALAFDTETTDPDPNVAELVGLGFSYKEGEAYYLPLGHREGQQLDIADVIRALKPVLEDPKIAKVGHNLKYDYQMMRRQGVELAPIAFDTMIAAFLINPLGRAQTLGDLAYGELGIEMITIEELIGEKKRGQIQAGFDAVTVEDAIRYAAEDADISWRLYHKLDPQLKKSGLEKLAADLEWPLIPVLAEMELTGITLDTKRLDQFNKVISKKILALEEQIWEAAGERFNISSPGQLGAILFNKLGVTAPGIRRGKAGSLSTAARELEKLRGQHPMIEHLFEYRELVKLKTTYVDALPLLVNPADGRIHTSFNQTIAQTGRLSSTNPNLQNIPIRTELGKQIRFSFVAPKGRKLISADYSQFELRIAAALSGDQGMIKAFQEGIDVHTQTAAELYAKPLDKISDRERYNAKTVNFGVLYGMSPHGLSVATGMSREEATDFIARYYDLRPQLKDYIEKVKADARTNEYVSTHFGRRRPCPEINSNNFMVASAAERMAVNVPIQGTQADLMKLAMVQLEPKLDDKTQILLQIHDELIAETEASSAERVASLMKKSLEAVYALGVPIEVDTSIGQSWGEL